jgi:hypothetical protein
VSPTTWLTNKWRSRPRATPTENVGAARAAFLCSPRSTNAIAMSNPPPTHGSGRFDDVELKTCDMFMPVVTVFFVIVSGHLTTNWKKIGESLRFGIVPAGSSAMWRVCVICDLCEVRTKVMLPVQPGAPKQGRNRLATVLRYTLIILLRVLYFYKRLTWRSC